ncbi:TIGR03808 family TAT-translocated repetitive protein [Devosia sp. Root635]|uniref:TIGR03808 family TAT-translocated repetitive protein n=1 Tax=Devosia sp. Root635 TaxID=1736575 RepID=UPI000A6FEDE0|nr:TIGR03808 family TAT-translocated repetitive protein [Devosia sp. Root635]
MLANRRLVLAGIASLAAPPAARAQSVLDATTLGVAGDTAGDQGPLLQAALDQAATAGQALQLPAGIIQVSGLDFPSNLVVQGVPGRTELTLLPDGDNLSVHDRGSLVLRDIGFASGTAGIAIVASDDITLERCRFRGSEIGVSIADAGVTISDCHFTELGDAAIHAMDSRGLFISGNSIDQCGNAGIRIWRSQSGADGSIVTGNRIANIDWRGGGNGQNGNGINVFKADEVIVANNHIADCAFTAIRLNATNNTQVSGNTCLRSGEVAIFSEFEFSGSVIANNIVDGAATGISITNLDSGGQLAVCAGNIVRNITPNSPVNPDTIPIGIFAEAEAAITGNTVQNVPGIAIAAGYGSFLRNVLISGNVVSQSDIGIGVSVVEGAGPVHLGSNAVSARQHAIVGLAWTEVVEADLIANAGRYPNVSVR